MNFHKERDNIRKHKTEVIKLKNTIIKLKNTERISTAEQSKQKNGPVS